jgi:hypothetical protein
MSRTHLRNGAIGLLAAVLLSLLPAPPANAASPGIQATVLYKIEQTTGDVSDGGTDSTVLYQLCGTLGCTAKRVLDDPNKDDRERGNTDIYTREWEDVGTLTLLRIYQHDDGSVWYLDAVRIIYKGQIATFVYDRWLPREIWNSLPAA